MFSLAPRCFLILVVISILFILYPSFIYNVGGYMRETATDDNSPIINEDSNRNCGFVTYASNGLVGLGNKMFMYASLFGVAKYNQKTPYIKDFFGLDKIFNLSVKVMSNQSPNVTFDYRPEGNCCKFDNGSLSLDCDTNIVLAGYRQSWRYFEKFAYEIKKEFTFVEEIEAECSKKINEIRMNFSCERAETCILIAVHLRRGDFVKPKNLAFGYLPATQRYLREAVKYFDEQFKNDWRKIIYVILGVDYEWNQKSSTNITENDILVLPNKTQPMDLCIMTKCNHTVFSTGSFGWWTGYLSSGNVTYMKDQCKRGSTLCTFFEDSDYINPQWQWIPLNW